MTNMAKRKFLGGVLCAAMLAAMAPAGAQNAQPPIKVGLLFGFTGPAAIAAVGSLAAAKLAVKEINDAGGLLGRQLELVQADHQFDPANTVSEARRLVQREKVDVSFGPEASFLAVAVGPIFAEGKIPYFSTTVSVAQTPYNFTALMSGETQAIGMLDFAAKHLKAKTIAVFADSGTVGKALQEDVKKYAPEKGLTVTIMTDFANKTTDVTPQLLAIRKTNPDVIIHSGSLPADSAVMLKNMDEINYHPVIVSTVFGQAPRQVMELAGPDVFKSGKNWGFALKAYTYCAKEKPGQRLFDQYLVKLKAAEPANFEKIDAKTSLYVYEPMMVWRAAVEATKSLDGPGIVAWIEQNGSKLRGAGAGYPISYSKASHFMWGPDATTVVQRPDLVRAEDKLVERQTDCP